MIYAYAPILILIILATIIAFLAIFLGVIFGPRHPYREKSVPYESGISPYGTGRRRVPVKYYVMGVLFILFDIEVIFFLPWAVVVRQVGITGLIVMIIFGVIFETAFFYAWKKGAMEWE
jgi:NADH-quinone oxidoreductase subunit A